MSQLYLDKSIANFNVIFLKSASHMVQVEEQFGKCRAALIVTFAVVDVEGSLLDDKIDFVGETSKEDRVGELLLKDNLGGRVEKLLTISVCHDISLKKLQKYGQPIQIQITKDNNTMSIVRKFIQSMQYVVAPRVTATSQSKILWSSMPFLFLTGMYYIVMEEQSTNYDEMFYQLYDLKKVGDIEGIMQVKKEEVVVYSQQEEKLKSMRKKFMEHS